MRDDGSPQPRTGGAPIMPTNTVKPVTTPKPASEFTKKANNKFADGLELGDVYDFADAYEHLVFPWKEKEVKGPGDSTVWTIKPYLDQEKREVAPETVNPSLWRQARLNVSNGLFQ